ncbi:MAG: hypothetical protein LBB13_03975 [Rickettsiales bacterium]|jgi:hypothetical protein|nr:hypothetical protein [Rickettsiales bacterium]
MVEQERKEEDKSKLDSIDFASIDYEQFEEIDKKHIDLYCALNDSRSNPEFLDDDLVKLSKKEEEMKTINLKTREEFEFDMEELVDDGSTAKVDLSGIIDNISNK